MVRRQLRACGTSPTARPRNSARFGGCAVLCASGSCNLVSALCDVVSVAVIPAVADGIDCPEVPRRAGWLSELFRGERPHLARYLRRHVHNTEDAADLLQDAFARLASVHPSTTLLRPEAYLQRIVRNLVVDRARHRLREGFGHLGLDDCELPVVNPEQEYGIEARDLMRRYRMALEMLTPRTREVFLLHRVEEITYGEIARRLGITVATVEYHMTRALIHLDEALAE